jgi:D-Tyr-tRNAtyr deacylase
MSASAAEVVDVEVESASSVWCRTLVQQVESAELLIDNVSEYVQIGNGIVIMLALLKRADVADAEIAAMCSKILSCKIHTVPGGPVKSHFRAEPIVARDVLIVPQATMSGKLRKGQPQYHAQVAKDAGALLYERVWREFEKQLAEINATRAAEHHGKVLHGTYGNRQALKFASSGPNTHLFDW